MRGRDSVAFAALLVFSAGAIVATVVPQQPAHMKGARAVADQMDKDQVRDQARRARARGLPGQNKTSLPWWRRRQQQAGVESACDNGPEFATLSDSVMQHCCPPAPKDAPDADCELPALCDNTGCADEFLPFYDACYPLLQQLSADRLHQFEAFNIGCEVRLSLPCSPPEKALCKQAAQTAFLCPGLCRRRRRG